MHNSFLDVSVSVTLSVSPSLAYSHSVILSHLLAHVTITNYFVRNAENKSDTEKCRSTKIYALYV